MRDLPPPFRIDLRTLISKARKQVNSRIDGITINLPFITFNFQPDDLERKVARELVIRLADRRVLNAYECCDDCIDRALASLQEIRSILVEKQVELAKDMNSALYLMIEAMADSLRQFLTFEQRLKQEPSEFSIIQSSLRDGHRRFEHRDKYFAALEMLRAHLHRCLCQVSKIAGMDVPSISKHMRYDEVWQLEAYESLAMFPGY